MKEVKAPERRIIKFRAWDEYSKEMVYEDNFFMASFNPFRISRKDNRVVLDNIIQFVGELDVNGKEIYHLDIMKGKFGTGIGCASTKYKEFYFMVDWHEHSHSFHLNMPNNYGRYRFCPYLSNCEVVGNIYQNPELLTL